MWTIEELARARLHTHYLTYIRTHLLNKQTYMCLLLSAVCILVLYNVRCTTSHPCLPRSRTPPQFRAVTPDLDAFPNQLLREDVRPHLAQLPQLAHGLDPVLERGVRRALQVAAADALHAPALHRLEARLAEVHAAAPPEARGGLDVREAVVDEEAPRGVSDVCLFQRLRRRGEARLDGEWETETDLVVVFRLGLAHEVGLGVVAEDQPVDQVLEVQDAENALRVLHSPPWETSDARYGPLGRRDSYRAVRVRERPDAHLRAVDVQEELAQRRVGLDHLLERERPVAFLVKV